MASYGNTAWHGLVPYADAPMPELVLLVRCRHCGAPDGQRCGWRNFAGAIVTDYLHWHAVRVEDAHAHAALTA